MVSTYRRPIFQLNQISNKMVHFKTTKYKKKCISLVILKIPFIFSYNFKTINKTKINPNQYVPINNESMFKLGLSTRIYILHGEIFLRIL